MYSVRFSNTENGTWTEEVVHDELYRFLINPVLTRTLNKSGAFTFSIASDNPGYDMIIERRTEVYIYKNGTLFWNGCVLSCPMDMYGIKSVTCEGILGYLNDTVMSFGRRNIKLSDFLNDFAGSYNSYFNSNGQKYYRVKFAENIGFTGNVHILCGSGTTSEPVYKELISSAGFTSEQLSGKEYILPIGSFRGNMTLVFDNAWSGLLVQDIIPCSNAAPASYVDPKAETITKIGTAYVSYSNQLGQIYLGARYVCHAVYCYGKIKNLSRYYNISDLDTPDVFVTRDSYRDASETGMEKITNKLLNRYGGMITASKDNPRADIVLHYKQSLTDHCGQSIKFGKNLVDYLEENSFSNIANVIFPIGKNKGTDLLWDYVTIEDANDGRQKIMNDASVRAIGVIQKMVQWSDIEDPVELKSLAEKELENSVYSEFSISVSAIDEVMAGVDTEAFDIGLFATVEIEPLGISRELIITSITNNLMDLEKDSYTLGNLPSTSTSYSSSGSSGAGARDGEPLEDTGWVDAGIAASLGPYNDVASNTPQYRRIGKQVKIRGIVSPTAVITGSTTAKGIFTLPTGFRPAKNEYKVCQGSGKNTWLLTIADSGSVGVSRYGTTATVDIPVGAWLPFEHEFYVD